jgi:hypothetical protein
MATLDNRIAKLERQCPPDAVPKFTLVFVSTDGTPDRRCELRDGGLVDIDPP